jgi:hypothetical protein
MNRYLCCDELRLAAVKRAGALNGIEYVEVNDLAAPTFELRQRTLFVRLLRPVGTLTGANVRIEGGERIRDIAVVWAAAANALPVGEVPALVADLTELDHVLVVRTDKYGDHSWYTLRLVAGPGSDDPPALFDPLLVDLGFSFKAECDTDFDCRRPVDCSPVPVETPGIDYLAKDYSSLRRLLLDRMSLLSPGWQERSPADLGVTLVELLAYVGDQLSYRQDAIATEAYIGTARSRISLRRHARIVDYEVHEGCSARVLVRLTPQAPATLLERGTVLLTQVPGAPPQLTQPQATAVLEAGSVTVFETVEDTLLYPDHDVLHFYTWGERACCLPRGATSATLVGQHPALKAGDVLVLAEILSPTTGAAGDADIRHRWPVRLTSVTPARDPSGGLFQGSPDPNVTTAVTEIAWDRADALPWPLCVRAGVDDAWEVGVAWGNIVLADHGRSLSDEDLGEVPAPRLAYAVARGPACADEPKDTSVPARYRPMLRYAPISRVLELRPAVLFTDPATAVPLADLVTGPLSSTVESWLTGHGVVFTAGPARIAGGDGQWSVSDGQTVIQVVPDVATVTVRGRPVAASQLSRADPAAARPAVRLTGKLSLDVTIWQPRFDLLASDGDAPEFVVETEYDGTAMLRFGDSTHGRRPLTGTHFTAWYRTGNGVAGNIGAGSIGHAVTAAGITAASNPLPAAGGVDPETATQVRRDAPEAFFVLERAVTEGDYGEVALRFPGVQRAAATIRWTGSWYTVFVTVDRFDGLPVDTAFATALRAHLERYRMAGYDLEVDGPVPVPLRLALFICVRAGYHRGKVRQELLSVLGSGVRTDGHRGLFHPDNFTFGQPVYLSPVVAAAQAVPGVESVAVTLFERRDQPDPTPLETGVLPMERLEIAQLANDPNFPDRGTLELTLAGGL